MNEELYAGIFRRKSCQKFREEELRSEDMDGLVDFLSELEAPEGEIDWNFDTLPYLDMMRICSTAPAIRAPVYLVLRAERKNFSLQNCGYLGELAVLWLTARGVATCWQGSAQVDPNEDFRGSLPYVTCIAMGYGEDASGLRGSSRSGRKRKRSSLTGLRSIRPFWRRRGSPPPPSTGSPGPSFPTIGSGCTSSGKKPCWRTRLRNSTSVWIAARRWPTWRWRPRLQDMTRSLRG